MKNCTKLPLALIAASALAFTASGALAQGKSGGGQGAGQRQEQPTQQMRRPETTAPQRQKQAETSNQLRRELKDEDIYGHQIMTAEERDRYRERLNAAGSDGERAQLRMEHQEEMRRRADAAGRSLEPPIYGQHMMSAEERQRFTERMQSAASDAQRAEIQEQHREMINERARQLGVDPAGPNRGQ